MYCTRWFFLQLFTLLYLLYGCFGQQNFITMLQNILNNKISIVYILFIAICFVCIRAFEDLIFYDPLLSYYKRDFHTINLPTLNNFKIAIGGHTDGKGSEAYNNALSEERVKRVYEFFTAAGIKAERISQSSYGKSNPVKTNDTEAGRRINRRVEVRIIK